MEGVLEEECYDQAKNGGSKVEVVWQDGESSTAKSITLHHPASKVYKCGEHVGRAQSNRLKEAAKFLEDVKTKYKAKFPKPKLWSANANDTGLVVAAYEIQWSKFPVKNICVVSNSALIPMIMQSIRVLLKYHVRDIHTWDKDGSCNFHPVRTCSCKKCERRWNQMHWGAIQDKTTTQVCFPLAGVQNWVQKKSTRGWQRHTPPSGSRPFKPLRGKHQSSS